MISSTMITCEVCDDQFPMKHCTIYSHADSTVNEDITLLSSTNTNALTKDSCTWYICKKCSSPQELYVKLAKPYLQ